MKYPEGTDEVKVDDIKVGDFMFIAGEWREVRSATAVTIYGDRWAVLRILSDAVGMRLIPETPDPGPDVIALRHVRYGFMINRNVRGTDVTWGLSCWSTAEARKQGYTEDVIVRDSGYGKSTSEQGDIRERE